MISERAALPWNPRWLAPLAGAVAAELIGTGKEAACRLASTRDGVEARRSQLKPLPCVDN